MKNDVISKIFNREKSTTKSTKRSKDTEIPTVSEKEPQVANPIVEQPQDQPLVNHPVDKLLTVLYWVWDSADRALIKVFVVGKTAQAVKNNMDLSGDRITCGIRNLEWRSSGRRIFDTCMGAPINEDNVRAIYSNSGIDVYIYFFDDESEITTLDTVYYRYENFWVPTPLDTFEQKHGDLWK